jgi:hypothetical protein
MTTNRKGTMSNDKTAATFGPDQPTGDQMWQKIVGDDLYRDFEQTPAPARSWMPTKGEIGLALGIVTFIIVLFAFVATAYLRL